MKKTQIEALQNTGLTPEQIEAVKKLKRHYGGRKKMTDLTKKKMLIPVYVPAEQALKLGAKINENGRLEDFEQAAEIAAKAIEDAFNAPISPELENQETV